MPRIATLRFELGLALCLSLLSLVACASNDATSSTPQGSSGDGGSLDSSAAPHADAAPDTGGDAASDAGADGRATPSFSVQLAGPTLAIGAGYGATLGVAVSRSGGFTGAITVTATGLPPGVTASPLTLDPTTASGQLGFTATSAATLGHAAVTVAATSGTAGHDAALDLDVVAATSGAPDPGFGSGGSFVSAQPGSAVAVAVQADGKILVAGTSNNAFTLLRLQSDGTLDSSFGSSGVATAAPGSSQNGASAMVVQPDGRIVVAGFSSNASAGGFGLARFNTDGSLDGTFGTGGQALDAFGAIWSESYALALQADGRLVAAGYVETAVDGGLTQNDSCIARFDVDGTLDTTFGNGGFEVIDQGPSGVDDEARSVVVQSDGKLVVVGQFDSGGPGTTYAARVLSDGTLDTTYATGSAAVLSDLSPGGAILQSDGKAVTIGSFQDNFPGLLRLTTTGSVDATFGFEQSGVFSPFFSAGADAGVAYGHGAGGALQSDQKLLLVGNGSTTTSGSSFLVMRSTTDGNLDTSFAGGQVFTQVVGGNTEGATAVAVAPDGRIVVAGNTVAANNESSLVVLRYFP